MSIFFPPYQELLFLFFAALGLILGVIYDAFSVKRILLGSNAVICFIDDLIFMFVSGCLFLIMAFLFNNGIIRWYEFFSCLMGFFIYKLTVSRLVMLVMSFAVKFIKRLVRKLIKISFVLFSPFAAVIALIYRLIKWMLKPLFSLITNKLTVCKIEFGYKNMCLTGK